MSCAWPDADFSSPPGMPPGMPGMPPTMPGLGPCLVPSAPRLLFSTSLQLAMNSTFLHAVILWVGEVVCGGGVTGRSEKKKGGYKVRRCEGGWAVCARGVCARSV